LINNTFLLLHFVKEFSMFFKSSNQKVVPMSKPASRQQTWTIFKLTGKDVRNDNLTYEQASEMIQAGLAAKQETLDNFQRIYDEARAAGLTAGNAHRPIPMRVVEHTNPLDDNSPIKTDYGVYNDGACGFAWVIVKPGNSKFANWLKKNEYARPDSYYGGVSHWVGEFNQSYERKGAYARAFAAVLTKHGIKAYSYSRMD
jgi:hypothetical protein